ncbi:MAG: zinc ribbon domain-containing protein [Thermoplasmata archaeon]|nr:zinc ribbon domain-containing protein [Thermoplasmata archaeon]
MFCSNCGKEMPDGARFCPDCGWSASGPGAGTGRVDVNTAVMFNKKSEGLALILSLIIPGLGQMYVGRVQRGILMLALIVVMAILDYVGFIAVASVADGHTSPETAVVVALVALIVVGIVIIVLWIYGMYDAYRLAKEYNAYLLENGGQTPW